MALTPSPSRRLIVPKRDASPRGFVPAPMPLSWPDHAAAADLDYSIDVAQLLDSTDTVSSASAAALPGVPGGLTVGDVDVDGTMITVWLSGGVDGVDYEVQLTYSTDSGRTDQMNIAVSCRDRVTI